MPNYYDPSKEPSPEEWLVLDESDRISQAEKYHKKNRIRLPSTNAHDILHVAIVNQISEREEAVTRAMARLQMQGLSRHDSIHALAWVLSQQIYEHQSTESSESDHVISAVYRSAVERINAKDWLAL